MTTLIKDIFDPSKDIYRTIEKVITYSASQEKRLESEITEYIVTDNIEEQFQKLMTQMQIAWDSGDIREIGVWVSGFYGSGKSSFTKYLGFALDEHITIQGRPFWEYLRDRMNLPTTRAQLTTLVRQHPAAVVPLDLASEMLAGASMEAVSTVLYYKVLQWAGFSQNLKVAALERRLRKDGKYEEFHDIIKNEYELEWEDVKNDPLVVDSVIPEVAHRLYPQLFKTPEAFHTETSDIITFEPDRVKEMLDIIREKTHKKFIVFVIDEVGQYVGSRDVLITNLDGLAKNLKNIGEGNVWIIGTAQQTLTEDDPNAALNSPLLFKLKDRFPIQINLESSDIKEICVRRLLGKSPEGQTLLRTMFDNHGQALRFNTKLQDARFYDSDFDKEAFVNLYPFLPAHFAILLHLLGALAKSTGGVGLRSAIKVIQDILIEGTHHDPVANKPIGWLATTVTLYDVLEKDIRRAFSTTTKGFDKAQLRFGEHPIHMDVAKTVAILQNLGNMPVTAQNVCSLIHPGVDAPSQRDEVDAAITDLINDAIVPFGEKEGNLCFFSERLNDIDQERANLVTRSSDKRQIQNKALLEAFTPLPATRLADNYTVTSGLKTMLNSICTSLAGDRNTIQTVVEFILPQDYDTERTKLVDDSRQHINQNTIYLIGRVSDEIDSLLNEIFRCEEIANKHRNDADTEIKDYCTAQTDRANRLREQLIRQLKKCLASGSFIFRGQTTPVDTLDNDVLEASKKYLGNAAKEVFNRFADAPVRVETTLAEKFLKTGKLQNITSALDPLGLVQKVGSSWKIKTDHKAIISIKDHLESRGTEDGKRLQEVFGDAPFGWSPDTLRYLLAAMLLAGEIKLKISGHEITSNGQQALEALKTNNSFKNIGVSLRNERPSDEVVSKAAERLTELTGDMVIPLEDDVCKAASKFFTQAQHAFGSLPEKLKTLDIAGSDSVISLNENMAEMLQTDASDAPYRLGAEDSILYANLKWAKEIERSLKNGLEDILKEFSEHRHTIETLPDSGIPGDLRKNCEDAIGQVRQYLSGRDFHCHMADISSRLTTIKNAVADAVSNMSKELEDKRGKAAAELTRMPEWAELTSEEQSMAIGRVEELPVNATHDLHGLTSLKNQSYDNEHQIQDIRANIQHLGQERIKERIDAEHREAKRAGQSKLTKDISVPAIINNVTELDQLLQTLQTIKSEFSACSDIEIKITIKE